MEKLEYYNKLYELQDKVLKVIFKNQHSFYLTDGTALHRFIYNERFSDDLDLFANALKTFAFEYKNIYKNLTNEFNVVSEIDGYGFKRIIINDDNLKLKVDFVNDLEFRVSTPEIKNGFVIDTVTNIFVNKISAIMGRDEAKDIFDFIIIQNKNNFKWNEIFALTKNKINFDIDEFIFRLENFPVKLLNKIISKESLDLNFYQNNLNRLIKEIKC